MLSEVPGWRGRPGNRGYWGHWMKPVLPINVENQVMLIFSKNERKCLRTNRRYTKAALLKTDGHPNHLGAS